MATVKFCGESSSPQFSIGLAPQDFADAESTSICPLLTPSPSDVKLLSTSSDFLPDEESTSTCPLLSTPPPEPLFSHPLEPVAEPREDSIARDILLESSSSSSTSALPTANPACVQLLSHYQQFDEIKNEVKIVEKQLLDIDGRKLPPDYCFIHWNWPVIRKSCFWSVVSLTIACFCIVIGIVANVPKKCYPPHEWHQGAVFYEIFPASFQDSDNNGIGDLRGISTRLDYFKQLGINAIHLNSIFQSKSYPEDYEDIESLIEIDKHLGDLKDFTQLVSVLHSANISIVLDLPIYPFATNQRKGKKTGNNVAEKISNTVHNHRSHRGVNESKNQAALPYIDGGYVSHIKSKSEQQKTLTRTLIEEAILFWFEQEVDGIFIKGLEKYLNESGTISELESWTRIKSSYEKKILMADLSALNSNKNFQNQILNTFDLINVHLSLHSGDQTIFKILEDPNFQRKSPWIHWNVGDVTTDRLAASVSDNLGALCFALLLPGTVSIFYGDEIGLSESYDVYHEHFDTRHHHHLTPMIWRLRKNFTSSNVMPWVPYGKSQTDNFPHLVKNLTELRKMTPAIYMGNFQKNEKEVLINADYLNFKGLKILERNYPRRNTYVVIYNAAANSTNFDLSHFFYGGTVMVSSNDDSGNYVSFRDISIPQGVSIVVKLDM